MRVLRAGNGPADGGGSADPDARGPEEQRLVDRDALRASVRMVPASAAGMVSGVAAVAFLAWDGGAQETLLLWAALIIGLEAFIVTAARGLVQHERQPSATEWTTRIMVPSAGLGGLWGMVGLLRPETRAVTEWIALSFGIQAAISAGGVVVYSPLRRVAMAFLAPLWAVSFVVAWGSGAAALAVGGAVVFAVMLTYNHVVHESLDEAFRLRHTHARLNERLQASDAFARAVIETAAEAIWIVDRLGLVHSANPAALRLMKAEVGDVVGKPLSQWLDDALAAQPGVRSHESELVSSTGERRPVIVSTSAIDGGAGSRVAVMARDIADRKALERRLEHDARHDSLTGLPNRAGLVREIAGQQARCSALGCDLALLFVDLDRFKQVNDVLGHRAGDRLLREVARRLREHVRRIDLVARLGGDEFVVLLPDAPLRNELMAMAQRLIEALEEPFVIEGEEARVSASIGLAYSMPNLPADALLANADVAMYRAKHSDKERVVIFDGDLQRAVEERMRTEHDLRRAIGADELEVWGQPIVSFQSGLPVGVELLARWRRGGELVSPDLFIPIAEETGMVSDLGRFVMRRAVEVLSEWRRHPALRELYLTVNASGRHLVGRDLASDLADALRLDPDCAAQLVVELTETHLAGDRDTAREALYAVRALGVGVAIDDFGTGYSSLAYLQDLPATIIKIDRVFVSRLTDDARQQAIVRSVVDVAAAFRQRVIAEGIETLEQAEAAAQLGVNYGQGFLFARPMPMGQLATWLAAIHSDAHAARAS